MKQIILKKSWMVGWPWDHSVQWWVIINQLFQYLSSQMYVHDRHIDIVKTKRIECVITCYTGDGFRMEGGSMNHCTVCVSRDDTRSFLGLHTGEILWQNQRRNEASYQPSTKLGLIICPICNIALPILHQPLACHILTMHRIGINLYKIKFVC